MNIIEVAQDVHYSPDILYISVEIEKHEYDLPIMNCLGIWHPVWIERPRELTFIANAKTISMLEEGGAELHPERSVKFIKEWLARDRCSDCSA